MNRERFCRALEWMQAQLTRLDVNHTLNSIGSNIFIDFGQTREVILPNQKRYIEREWTIWIADAAWRITQHEAYVGGSSDSAATMDAALKRLLGKRFVSCQILSLFLDVAFHFESGYCLTTFFNWMQDNQWTVFLPDQTSVRIGYSEVCSLKDLRVLAEPLLMPDMCTTFELPVVGKRITEIVDQKGAPLLLCEEGISIALEEDSWRLEKDGTYEVGSADDDAREKLVQVIGEKIVQVSVANAEMDARIRIGDRYVLQAFTCHRSIRAWAIK
jgi:hypothetical protein